MYGQDFNYAESRLADSIVRISKTGEPVQVHHIDQADGEVHVIYLKDNKADFVSLDDLNLKPVPLGWCNVEGGATYLARIPRRNDWRQGLRVQTAFSSIVTFQRIKRPDLAKCIRGEYPSFKELLAKRPWSRLTAWSRKWASDGARLYFGNLGEVGKLSKDGEPILGDGFTFLKESLAKSLA